MQETWVWPLVQEDPLEKEMAAHSSILAWEIPRTKEPDRLMSNTTRQARCLVGFCFGLFFGFGHTQWYVGFWFPDQGWNLCPLHWECEVLTTRKSHCLVFWDSLSQLACEWQHNLLQKHLPFQKEKCLKGSDRVSATVRVQTSYKQIHLKCSEQNLVSI